MMLRTLVGAKKSYELGLELWLGLEQDLVTYRIRSRFEVNVRIRVRDSVGVNFKVRVRIRFGVSFRIRNKIKDRLVVNVRLRLEKDLGLV